MIADRIGAFFRGDREFGCISHELPNDLIIGIGAVDELADRRRQRNRLTRRNLLEPCTIGRRDQPRLHKIVYALDRVLLKAVHVCPVYCRFCFRRE
ncbi:hypothetical protein ACC696_37590, partial [Rhizobium ruizarguesonis]